MAAEVFRAYYRYPDWLARLLVQRLIDMLAPRKRFIRVRPQSVEASLRRGADGSYLIHFVNWLAPRSHVLPAHAEELPAVEVEALLRLEREPRRVEAVPPGLEVEYGYSGGVLELRVRGLTVHAAVRVTA